MPITVGQDAPEFEIPLAGGKEKFILSNCKGKHNAVLLFFPLAWTPVCTSELCAMRDSFQEYKDLDAHVVGISVDSPFALAKFKEENNYPFDMASDFNKDVSKAYDTLYEDLMGFKGVCKRSAFVINKEGKVVYAEVKEDAHDLPDFEKIKAALKSA
ncbi:peroxiredoxin [candidate division BRC1 bacterium HGW-BRC1-1]|jgi:peroxiredoxin|nr:MAG: peroxiredoxin [candidate division BRC1 bacterium HGW-BRC1-1]